MDQTNNATFPIALNFGNVIDKHVHEFPKVGDFYNKGLCGNFVSEYTKNDDTCHVSF